MNHNFTTEKPVLDRECLIITASKINDVYEYELWRVIKMGLSLDGWHFSLFNSEHGEFPIDSLSADLYQVIETIK